MEGELIDDSYKDLNGCRKLVLGLLICSMIISITVIGFVYTIPIMWYAGLIIIFLLPVFLFIKNKMWTK